MDSAEKAARIKAKKALWEQKLAGPVMWKDMPAVVMLIAAMAMVLYLLSGWVLWIATIIGVVMLVRWVMEAFE